MRFLSLTVDAFNRFRAPFSVPLDRQGLVLVEGENLDHGGSNGSGKSLLFECLLWCLYNRMARYGDRPVTDNAIHPTRGASVEVHLALGGSTYIVRRARPLKGKATFSITVSGGATEVPYRWLSRDPAQRAEDVTALLGMDYAAARAAIVLQAVGPELARAGFAAQMSVVESVLRFDQLSVASDLARTRGTEADRTLARQEGLLHQQQRGIAQISEQVTTLEAHGDLSTDLAALSRRLDEEQRYAEHAPGLRELVEKQRGEVERARRDAVEAQTLRGAADTEKRTLETQAETAAVCPTCKRPFGTPEEIAAQRRALQERVAAANVRGKDAHRRWEKSEHAAQRGALRLHEYEEQLRQALAAEARIPGLVAQETQLQELQKGRQALIDQARAQLAAAEDDAAELETTVTAARRASGQYALWTRGYGRDGLQAELFAAAVPHMNNTARRLAPLILGDAVRVEFDPVRASRSEGLVRVSGSEAPTYEGLSSSQRQRVSLLLALGLRAAARLRLPDALNVSVYDETFNALDAESLQAVIALLNAEHGPDDTVFLVTNDPELKRLLPMAKVLRVVRKDGEAEVYYA